MNYAFGIHTRPERVRLDERITIPQLVSALNAAGLCLSNGINGELVIHRIPITAHITRPAVPCEGPPPPEAA